jgi:hypothetical protein
MRTKTGGRTVGTPNKATGEMRELLQQTFEQYASGQLHLDLQATDPETRLRFMVEVAKLITPKLSNVTLDEFREKSPFTTITIDVVD